MLSFKSFIEARRNPDANKKVSAYDELEKYKDDPNIYISMRDINKLGINPQSQWDTPNGIYTYNLKKYWPIIEIDQTLKALPFAGNQPFVYVVKPRVKVVNASEIDENKLDYYLKKLYDVQKIKVPSITELDSEAQQKAKIKTPAGILWAALWLLFDTNTNKWNKAFRDIGIYAFNDDHGGIVHSNEKFQTVFFSKEYLETIKVIDNKGYNERIPYVHPEEIVTLVRGGNYPKAKSKTLQMMLAKSTNGMVEVYNKSLQLMFMKWFDLRHDEFNYVEYLIDRMFVLKIPKDEIARIATEYNDERLATDKYNPTKDELYNRIMKKIYGRKIR